MSETVKPGGISPYNVPRHLGRGVLGALRQTGAVTVFMWRCVVASLTLPVYLGQTLRQFMRIGYLSLPVVGLTAIFTGAVLAVQTYIGTTRVEGEAFVPNIVAVAFTRELGPVLAGLMLAGRVGSAIAAEIGTMRVTEQLDALVTLSTNPFKFLMAPRVIAAVVTLPILVLIADIIGILGGFLVATQSLNFNPATYIQNTQEFLEAADVQSGLIKAAVFGFIIAAMGCYQGYHSRGGAQGVGAATTYAVVTASIMILAANYILTSVFFSEGTTGL